MSDKQVIRIQVYYAPVGESLRAIQNSQSEALLLTFNVQEEANVDQNVFMDRGSEQLLFMSDVFSLQKEMVGLADLHVSIKLLLCSLCEWNLIYVPAKKADLIRLRLEKMASLITTQVELVHIIFSLLVEYTVQRTINLEFKISQLGQGQQSPLVLAEGALALSPKHARGLATGSLAQFNRLVELMVQANGATGVSRTCLCAGIYLWHGMLDESHRYSQSIEGAGSPKTGDYWHAIMHRMEPDYFNAKYWNRRVGKHPVYEQLYQILSSHQVCNSGFYANTDAEQLISRGTWQPDLMVDLCEQSVRSKDARLMNQLMQIQQLEMLLLLINSAR